MENIEVCDICGSSLIGDGVKIAGLESINIIQCGKCGLVITSPRPDQDEMGDYYPSDYYAHNVADKTRVQLFKDKLRIYKGKYPTTDGLISRIYWKLLSKVFSDFFLFDLPYSGEGKKLLDIGCGTGDTLLWAKESGWDVYGVELNKNAVKHAHSRGLQNVRCGAIESIVYEDEYFDAIVMTQALEHVSSPRRILNKCHKMLKRDGYLMVTVPNFNSYPRRIFGDLWHALDIPKHLFHFNESTLEQLTKDCGFEVEVFRYQSSIIAVILNVYSFFRVIILKSPYNDLPVYENFRKSLLNMVNSEKGLRVSDIMMIRLRKK